MIKFSHIGQLYNVVRTVAARRSAGHAIERVAYRGRVKLHGSNASVVCRGDRLQAQSRNREINLGDDNLGFAGFCAGQAQAAAIRELESQLREATALDADRPLVLFGEWIGPGIQKGVAISQLPARQWVLFAAATRSPGPPKEQGDELEDEQEGRSYLEIPKLGERFAASAIYSIADIEQWELELDFGHRASLELAAGAIEELTLEVEACCPWGARFGVEGVGEGVVWQPLGEHFGDSELSFKSKGDRHQVAARQRAERAPIDPELLASVEAFVAYAVTEPRLAQGLDYLREHDLPVEMRSLGPFLKWLANDIRRECADELEHNDLSWKQVARGINEEAKTWFRKALSIASW